MNAVDCDSAVTQSKNRMVAAKLIYLVLDHLAVTTSTGEEFLMGFRQFAFRCAIAQILNH